jgi:Fe2+ transport system protein B
MDIRESNKKINKTGAQIVQLSVVVLVLLVLAFFVIKFVMGFIWWIVSFLAIAVLAINYKLIFRLFGYIRSLYAKNIYMGVGATLGGILAFTPFVGFLFLKTIWDFRKSGMLPSFGKKEAAAPVHNYNNNTLDTQYTEVPNKDTDSNFLQ